LSGHLPRCALFVPLALLLACSGSDDPATTPVNPVTTAAAAAEPTGAAAPPAAVDLDDPQTCTACHAAVVEEWTSSMHSRAHADNDPIFGSMLALRMKKQGEGIAEKCASCHSPRSPADTSTPAARNGVSCAACHAVESVDPTRGPGAKALAYTADTLRGPHDLAAGASPMHGTGSAAPHITDGKSLCLACHGETRTPAGQPACTTGSEYAQGAAGATCTGCHMPRVAGPSGSVSTRDDHASHAFVGPHHAWYWGGQEEFLATAADLGVALEDGDVVVTVQNLSSHGMPTGFPGRQASVRVRGLDARGETIWRNISDDPMGEDPQAVFNKVYVDADGAPTPAAFAVELRRDNRLEPGETRTLRYPVPAGIAVFEVSLVLRLLPPALAKTLGLADAPEAEPRTLITATSAR